MTDVTPTDAPDLAALQAQVEELKAELLALTAERDQLKDSNTILTDRLGMVQAAAQAADHSAEQWRQTAIANEMLHNAASTELSVLKAALRMRGTGA